MIRSHRFRALALGAGLAVAATACSGSGGSKAAGAIPASAPPGRRIQRCARITAIKGVMGYTRKPNNESPIPIHRVSRLAHQLETRRPLTRSAGALVSNTGTPRIMVCGMRCEAAINSGMDPGGCCPSESMVNTWV